MQEGSFSRTAFGVAMRRAEHQLFDDPRVLDDPLALRIVGKRAVESLRGNRKRADNRFSRAFRAFMVARSRYAEDQVALLVARGVTQCVVLGAGLDTFAYRSPHAGLSVFEVDYPATQTWKRKRLEAASITIPSSLTLAPVDFERQTLELGLEAAGFRPNLPAAFSWLGVTPYLSREACFSTLGYIARRPAGSGVFFDFAIQRSLLKLRQRLALYLLSRRVAKAGEPFRLFFDPVLLAGDLRRLGFSRTETLDGAQISSLYFKDRADGLRVVGGLAQLMGAWV
jgi:methyltransferase (TIGR00027 family)